MDLHTTGFVRRHGHALLERADLFETRKGHEFARTPEGLILLPGSFECEHVFEYSGDEDRVEVEATLADLAEMVGLG